MSPWLSAEVLEFSLENKRAASMQLQVAGKKSLNVVWAHVPNLCTRALLMDTSWLLLLIFVVTTSECSETPEPPCEDSYEDSFKLLEGEAFYFEPELHLSDSHPNEEFRWYKNTTKTEYISSDEKERIHYHGGAIFFLNLLTEDSGLYTARHINQLGECSNYYVRVNVLSASHRGNDALLYGNIKNSDMNKKVPCPDRVMETCQKFGGNFTWYKDFSLLQGNHAADLWVKNATKDHEGIYTCVCTWTHNHKVYNSSGSRRLKVEDQSAYRDTEILSPINKEQVADEGGKTSLSNTMVLSQHYKYYNAIYTLPAGFRIQLNCSVFCGTNVKRDCSARWYINGNPCNQTHGYRETAATTGSASKNTIVTTILTIEKVSAKDFQAEFKCVGTGFYTTKKVTLTLKRRESMITLVITPVCVLFFCVFAAVLVKCFAIDLALFFRHFFPQRSCNRDGKLYDAYVVYQMQDMDKVTEDALCQFVTETLPSVLEKKCGYQLFIYGRDDIPGEDRLERVENSVKQSRRLIVILTPGLGSGSKCTDQGPALPQNSVIGGFDWQVGLHHALVQREMSVILIQLGDTGPEGYSHLPVGLQHLIRKSAPLKWPEGSRGAASWNSRFWKRVRYLMPATPVKKYPQAVII